MSNLLEKNIKIAEDGLRFFQEWILNFSISDSDAIWVFMGLDAERILFFNYIDAFKQTAHQNYEHIAMIFPTGCDIHPPSTMSEPCYYVPAEQIAAVVRLYPLYPFSSRLIICDLDEPEGRMGHRLLQMGGGCTVDKIIKNILYLPECEL